MRILITALALAGLLSACAATDFIGGIIGVDVSDKIADETQERLEDYCEARGKNLQGRADTIDRVNANAGPGQPRLIAQDCDGDGLPDIEPVPTS